MGNVEAEAICVVVITGLMSGLNGNKCLDGSDVCGREQRCKMSLQLHLKGRRLHTYISLGGGGVQLLLQDTNVQKQLVDVKV